MVYGSQLQIVKIFDIIPSKGGNAELSIVQNGKSEIGHIKLKRGIIRRLCVNLPPNYVNFPSIKIFT